MGKRLRDIPETCPIYKEAESLHGSLLDEVLGILNSDMTGNIRDYADTLLGCVDRCRDVAGDLRDMCVSRGEIIEELEARLGEYE